MTTTPIHVDAANEQCSVAGVDEIIRKASACQVEAVQGGAAAEAEIRQEVGAAEIAARQTAGAEAEVIAQAGVAVTGSAGLDVCLNLVEAASDRNSDPAKSHGAGQMVEKGLATEVSSIESTKNLPVTKIETAFEPVNLLGKIDKNEGFLAETRGTKPEETTAQFQAVAECQMAMGLANQKVLDNALAIKMSAPAMGPGGAGQSIQQMRAQQQQMQLAQMPGMDVMMKPKGPTDAMLSDVKDDEGMLV